MTAKRYTRAEGPEQAKVRLRAAEVVLSRSLRNDRARTVAPRLVAAKFAPVSRWLTDNRSKIVVDGLPR